MVTLTNRRFLLWQIYLFFQDNNALRTQEISLESAAEMIAQQCSNELLKASRNKGLVLYRGERTVNQQPVILDPLPDLLLPTTYNNESVEFFQCLEQLMPPGVAKPSVGHIATGSRHDAALWGKVVSVWPLGTLTYIWPKHQKVFYPGSTRLPQQQQHCTEERSFVNQQFVIDQGLESALQNNKEVLFAARLSHNNQVVPCPFVACPVELQDSLMKLL